MALDEAILHCEEVAERNETFAEKCTEKGGETWGCRECAAEHRQLAEWLKELKTVQDIIKQHDRDSMPEDYWYIDKIRTVVLK